MFAMAKIIKGTNLTTWKDQVATESPNNQSRDIYKHNMFLCQNSSKYTYMLKVNEKYSPP